MTVENADIKFECPQCGQSLAIEKSGAGLTADCPICETPVTVPHSSSRKPGDFGDVARIHESGFAQPAAADPIPPAMPGNGRPSYADPGEEEMREELVNSAMENGLLESDLQAARQKITRLQQHLRKALDDGEKLTANATHTQAEIKSIQAERQQMKSELAQSRQRMAVWEGQVSESRAKISELASAVATAGSESATLRQDLERQAAEQRDYQARVEKHLAEREEALAAAKERAEEVIQALAASEEEIFTLRQTREQLGAELETACGQIEELGQIQSQLAATEENLRVTSERAGAAETRSAELQTTVDGLHEEIEVLRRNLDVTTAGHELLELRGRFDAVEAEHRGSLAALSERDAIIKALNASADEVKADLKKTRELYEDADRRAEAASEGKLLKDNDVLRGIIDRQNAVIAENNKELRSLRRGQFGLRTVYLIFGVALLGLVIFALTILKPHLLGP